MGEGSPGTLSEFALMKRLLILAILLALLAPVQAQSLTGDWKVEYSPPTRDRDGLLEGGNTVVSSDGEVVSHSWSSGVAPPSRKVLGKADAKSMKALETVLVGALRVKYNKPGNQSVYLALTHAGNRLQWQWQAGDKELPPQLKAVVEAVRSAVESTRKGEN